MCPKIDDYEPDPYRRLSVSPFTTLRDEFSSPNRDHSFVPFIDDMDTGTLFCRAGYRAVFISETSTVLIVSD